MSQYSAEFLADRKKDLEQMKEDTLRELDAISRYDEEAGSYVAVQPEYDAGDVEDAGDAGEEAEVFQDRVAAVGDLNKTLEETNAALEKMEKGMYGKCEASGDWISEERLEAYPAARTCSEDM